MWRIIYSNTICTLYTRVNDSNCCSLRECVSEEDSLREEKSDWSLRYRINKSFSWLNGFPLHVTQNSSQFVQSIEQSVRPHVRTTIEPVQSSSPPGTWDLNFHKSSFFLSRRKMPRKVSSPRYDRHLRTREQSMLPIQRSQGCNCSISIPTRANICVTAIRKINNALYGNPGGVSSGYEVDI